MKALLLTEYSHLEIVEQPLPCVAADEVLVRVEACGICGSDVHGYDGSSGRRIPPIVMGHEAAGTVEAVGAEVRGYAKHDRVTFDSTVYCGACAYCRSGEINLCNRRQVIGVSCGEYRRNGAFAEYVSVPERILYRLPEHLSFAEAAMLEAVSVALHAVRLSEVKGGESVLVVGAGMIGLLAMQAARAAGCGRVFVSEISESRLELARQAGADEAIPSADLQGRIRQLTDGDGVDLTLEAVGRDETVVAAINATRKGGTVTLIGNIAPEIKLPLQNVVSRQIRLQGSCASAGEYPRGIELLASGAIQVKPLITAVAALEDGPRWFERLHANEPNLMKVILASNPQ